MGRNKLNNLASGDILPPKKINDIHRALIHDVIGRSPLNAPKRDQNLGTTALRWDELRALKLFLNNVEIDPNSIGSPANIIISGRERTASDQAIYLTPDATPNGGTATIKAAAVDLKFKVNDQLVTATSDIAISGLTLAPSVNNTALVNDLTANGSDISRNYGERYLTKEEIVMDTVGSEITSRIGTMQAFMHNTDVFMAFIKDGTTLTDCRRGIFFDDLDAPIPRDATDNNVALTLLQPGWVFLQDDGITVDVTFNSPTVSFTEPASPVVDDYWFDIVNDTWKRFNGTAFVQIDRTYIGIVIMDDTDCIAAVSETFFSRSKRETWNRVTGQATGILRSNDARWYVGVDDREIRTEWTEQDFRDSDVAASTDTHDTVFLFSATRWYAYMAKSGKTFISTFQPKYDDKRRGFYHPNHNWRLAAEGRESSNTFLEVAQFPGERVDADPETDSGGIGGLSITTTAFLNLTFSLNNPQGNVVIQDGAGFFPRRPGAYYLEFSQIVGASTAVAGASDTVRYRTITVNGGITKEFARERVEQFPIAGGVGWRSEFRTGVTLFFDNANDAIRIQVALLTGTTVTANFGGGQFTIWYLGRF